MDTTHSSAGVYTDEKDISQYVSGVSVSTGAIVGRAVRGPVGVPTLITSKNKFTDLFGDPDVTLGYLHYSALAFLAESQQLYVVRVAPGALYGGIAIASVVAGSTTSATPWATGVADPSTYAFAATDLFVIYGKDPGVWNNDWRVVVYPNTDATDNSFYVELYNGSNTKYTERFLVTLKQQLDGYGRQMNIETLINRTSQYIRVKQNHTYFDGLSNQDINYVGAVVNGSLAGGNDGTAPTTADYLTAWETFRDSENIKVQILINGGLTDPSIQLRMDDIAQSRMDCCAILDTPSDKQAVADAITYRTNTLNLDSSYSALYSPDLYIDDVKSDKQLYVPPSGYVAAVLALTDRTAETWFTPAGMTRGHLTIRGVRQEYEQGDRDALVEYQINPMRVIYGSGVKVWGADTLQTMKSALQNLNVRRLMIFLESSLDDALLYNVFDPNDFFLRSSITQKVNAFLKPIKAGRGIYYGECICDDSNNTAETIANGDLIVDVYIDPVLPVKRIHLTAVINKTGSTVTLNP